MHFLEYLAAMVRQRCVNPFFHRIDLQPNSYIAVSFYTLFLPEELIY